MDLMKRRKSMGDALLTSYGGGTGTLLQALERRPSATGLPSISKISADLFSSNQPGKPLSHIQKCLALVSSVANNDSNQQEQRPHLDSRWVPDMAPANNQNNRQSLASHMHPASSQQQYTDMGLMQQQQTWTPNYSCTDYSTSQPQQQQQQTQFAESQHVGASHQLTISHHFSTNPTEDAVQRLQRGSFDRGAVDFTGGAAFTHQPPQSGQSINQAMDPMQQLQQQASPAILPARISPHGSRLLQAGGSGQVYLESQGGWWTKHPCAWSPADCAMWFRSVADDNGLDIGALLSNGAFNGVNGASLMRMDNIEFLMRNKEYGEMLYHALRRILDKSAADPGQFIPKLEPVDNYMYGSGTANSSAFLSSGNSSGSVSAPDMSEYLQDHYTNDEFDDIDVNGEAMTYPACVGAAASQSCQPIGNAQYCLQSHNYNMAPQNYSPNQFSLHSDGMDYKSEIESDTDRSCSTYSAVSVAVSDMGRAVYSYGSYSPTGRSSSSADSTPPRHAPRNRAAKPEKAKSRSKHGTRGNHLWEFIRDLLKDSKFRNKIIKWENEEEGVFRFVESETVAKMWGEKKCNPRMTYEKLSRAMRYYYKSNILLPVIGRRLVYKFGPKATGWRA